MTGPTLPIDWAIPQELKDEIEASVKRFEEQWGPMKAFAKSQGYFDNYRKEISSLVLIAYGKGLTGFPIGDVSE